MAQAGLLGEARARDRVGKVAAPSVSAAAASSSSEAPSTTEQHHQAPRRYASIRTSPAETAAHERRRPRTQTSPRPTYMYMHMHMYMSMYMHMCMHTVLLCRFFSQAKPPTLALQFVSRPATAPTHPEPDEPTAHRTVDSNPWLTTPAPAHAMPPLPGNHSSPLSPAAAQKPLACCRA